MSWFFSHIRSCRWPIPALLPLAAGIGLLLAVGCGPGDLGPGTGPSGGPPELREPERKDVPFPAVRFTDITEKAGIRFRHTNGSFGKKLLPETLGSGVAFLDFDNDGHQDLLFVNSCYWPGFEDKSKPTPTLALYRNKGDGTFEDVTSEAGLAELTMYGMGVTVGDYDNDGFVDVFITGVGGNRLLHNRGKDAAGKWLGFEDVTASAGDLAGPGGWPAGVTGDTFLSWKKPINFSTSASFLDYDGDGKLDLFVCNYVTWSPDVDLAQGFSLKGVGRAFGPPTAFEGAQCFLYRNMGGGKFKDVSAEAGVQVFEKEGTGEGARQRSVAKSLGVIVCDVDDDGWPDIIVANDTVRNFFFHNVRRGDGSRGFEEIGMPKGVAYAEGKARGAMGIDAGECRPGQLAIIISNFANEPSTLLCLDNRERLLFSDGAMAEGLYGPSRSLLKFGTFFFDYDLDGRLDLLTCNGHLEPEIGRVLEQEYRQPVQLFWNSGGKACFAQVPQTGPAGTDLFRPLVGRGCAYADIDGDGDLDVVLTENRGPARLLRNDGGNKNHWIRLVLEGDGLRSNRSAIGARVYLEAGGVVQRREVAAARGYLSQSELPLTFGLGQTTKVDKVTIYWPGREGGKLELKDLEVNKVHHIRQTAK
jgi:hypothetical protein